MLALALSYTLAICVVGLAAIVSNTIRKREEDRTHQRAYGDHPHLPTNTFHNPEDAR